LNTISLEKNSTIDCVRRLEQKGKGFQQIS
jgi:hypothetical protein